MNRKVMQNICASTTILFWSLAFPLTKYITEGLSYYTIGLIRSTVAAVVLLMIGRAMHIRKPFKASHLAVFAVEGLLGFSLYLICFNHGMLTVTSATSSLILALTPVFTAVGAARVFGEKLKPAGWICILTAFAGVSVLLLWNGEAGIGIGALWTLAAVLLFSGYNLINRKLSHIGYTSVEIVTYAMCFGAVEFMVFLPESVPEIMKADAGVLLVTVFLGVTASAIAYFTWSKAFECADKISEVTNYMFFTPVLTAVEAVIILGEIPDMGIVIGGSVIMASVIVFNLRGK